MRYEVTEIEGFLTGLGRGSNASPGLSNARRGYPLESSYPRHVAHRGLRRYGGEPSRARSQPSRTPRRHAQRLDAAAVRRYLPQRTPQRTPDNVHTRSDGRTECLACRKAWYAAR